jgi:two-component system chemotaxis sensor kinase CheA
MADQRGDIKTRLLAIFRVEAQEHLQAIEANLGALGRGVSADQVRDVVEATFREMHTLKGAARSVNLRDIESLCQTMETLLSGMARGSLTLTPAILEHLRDGTDGVERLLAGGSSPSDVVELTRRLEQAAGQTGEPDRTSPSESRTQDVPRPKEAATLAGAPIPREPNAPGPVAQGLPLADTVRLSTARLDALLLQAEDLLTPKLITEERAQEIQSLMGALGRCRVELNKSGRQAAYQAGAPASPRPSPPSVELEEALRAVETQGRDLLARALRDQRAVAGTVNGLLEALRQLRLVPAETILGLFPRMVRDLAEQHGKEVEWTVRGADLDVDRKILEAMKEPLIHLVRNAIDHGIETPDTRRQGDKPSRGHVGLVVSPLEGERIEFRVEDDGRGIDPAKVREAAIRSRTVSAAEGGALTDSKALELVYRSGVTTNQIITDVSGHGLGLAIVKEQVERHGGETRIESRIGAGTTVRMILPATIATFRGLLVHAGGFPFLLPLEAVERAIRIAPDRIQRVEGRNAIRWNDAPLSLVRLGDVLGLPREEQPLAVSHQPLGIGRQPQTGPQPSTPSPQSHTPCVVVAAGEGRVGFLVGEVLGTREVLVKEFKPPLVRLRHVAAAGLLGTGQIVLILRVSDLLRSVGEPLRPPEPAVPPQEAIRHRAILVVDDSITTRTMERNLLEAAGFRVRVAADGLDAWTVLRTEEFDLVLSDVDMPRMDGFELTTRIRSDRKLADLPVVLVTALESREDKERGIEVGANAYIVKSSFDQSNLLEIIRRLI